MAELTIDALVFDVLGTLVDEPAGLRAGISALASSPGVPEAPHAREFPEAREAPEVAAVPEVERLLLLWQRHIEREQRRIVDGDRPYLPSDHVDREAAGVVAEAAGVDDPAAVETLARSARSLPPWPDTVAGLTRLAARFPLIGLSNASRTALLELNAHAGLRWHQALSAEDARTYKPDPAVYRLAVTVAGRPPERLLMVAAHAWDLRGAQALGLRTAYVARPVGDPPTSSDRFDVYAEDLADLAAQLGVA